MKCPVHGIEMEYAGETPFGDDQWHCELCFAAEEYEFTRCHTCGNPTDECICDLEIDDDDIWQEDDYYKTWDE